MTLTAGPHVPCSQMIPKVEPSVHTGGTCESTGNTVTTLTLSTAPAHFNRHQSLIPFYLEVELFAYRHAACASKYD